MAANGIERPRKLGRGLASLLGAPVRVEDVAQATNVAAATHGDARRQAEENPPARAGGSARGGSARGGSVRGGAVHTAHAEDSASGGAAVVASIALDQIVPSPFQPRQRFEEGGLRELAESIRTAGVMQPVLVRSAGAGYELIAGERRWRAAALAGLSAIPAIVVEATDQTAAEWALIENVQRVDLGPVERARAMGALADRFALTHEQIASRLGMDRASVTNHLRLLELTAEELALVERGGEGGGVTMGHAKAVLGLPGHGSERRELLLAAARERWSVRRLEEETHRVMVKMMGEASAVLRGKAKDMPGRSADELIAARARAAQVASLEKRLMEHLGTKVRIITNGKGTKGRIVVEFYSVEGFEGVVGKMGVE